MLIPMFATRQLPQLWVQQIYNTNATWIAFTNGYAFSYWPREANKYMVQP